MTPSSAWEASRRRHSCRSFLRASRLHYRNKLEYSFAPGEDRLELGFHRAGRWDEVIDIDECLLTTELGNGVRDAVTDWVWAEGLMPYDQNTQTGYLRHLVVRRGGTRASCSCCS